MATFAPGHLHIERHALTSDDVSYNLHFDYEVSNNDKGKKASSSPCMAAFRERI